MLQRHCKQFLSTAVRNNMEVVSDLAYITFDEKNGPFALFSEWIDEAKECLNIKTVVMNLATASREGDVSNRNVVLRELKNSSFVFMGPEPGKKFQHIKENPKVALCFLFNYMKEEKIINRQVRVEGIAQKLSKEECKKYYYMEPMYCKIRAHICQQGDKTDWNDLKKKHDKFLQQVLDNCEALDMPDNQLAYEVLPKHMEFYYSFNNYIADRITFTRNSEEEWECERICS